MTRPVIDLTRYTFKRHVKDLTVYGTWLASSDDESEPALVIVPTHRGNHTYRPAVVALSAAFKYDNPIYLARAAALFAKGLGMDSLASAVAIGEAIADHLPDLVCLPPEPMETHVIGEGSIGEGRDRKVIQLLDHTPIMM